MAGDARMPSQVSEGPVRTLGASGVTGLILYVTSHRLYVTYDGVESPNKATSCYRATLAAFTAALKRASEKLRRQENQGDKYTRARVA